MKKNLFFIMGIVLPVLTVFAQSPNGTKPLSIGDTVPDIVFNNIINYKKTSAKLSDFKGKLVILDFWATWCGPCVAGMPKLDSLQEKYNSQLQVIAVTYEKEEIVAPFLQRKKLLNLPSVVSEVTVKQWFPYRLIPHSAWINDKGVVISITSSNFITEANIQAALRGDKLNLPLKKDIIEYHPDKPLFLHNFNANDTSILYYSIVTRHADGLASQQARMMDKGKNIGFHDINSGIAQSFLLTYGKPLWYWQSRLVLENVADSFLYVRKPRASAAYITEWNLRNTYCYEILAPALSFEDRKIIMRQDLDAAFRSLYGLTAFIDHRPVKCQVLTITDTLLFRSIRREGKPAAVRYAQNRSLEDKSVFLLYSMDQLASGFESKFHIVFKNNTSYEGVVDFEISNTITAAAKNGNLQPLKKALAAAGLSLREEKQIMEVLVMREDRKPDNQTKK